MNYMCINLFSSKLFSPAINIVINYSLEKSMRSAMNSIFYLGVSFTLYIINYATKEILNYYFDDLLAPETFLVKYQALGFLIVLQIIALVIIMLTKINTIESKSK